MTICMLNTGANIAIDPPDTVTAVKKSRPEGSRATVSHLAVPESKRGDEFQRISRLDRRAADRRITMAVLKIKHKPQSHIQDAYGAGFFH